MILFNRSKKSFCVDGKYRIFHGECLLTFLFILETNLRENLVLEMEKNAMADRLVGKIWNDSVKLHKNYITLQLPTVSSNTYEGGMMSSP